MGLGGIFMQVLSVFAYFGFFSVNLEPEGFLVNLWMTKKILFIPISKARNEEVAQ